MSKPNPSPARQVTPIFFVDAIEPVLAFWEKQGWTKTVEVPHDGRLGFVILTSGEHPIMFQTHASLSEDLPAVRALKPSGALYIDVPSLADAVAASKGARVLVAERETFYGAKEAWLLDPAGTVVGLAEPKE